MKTELQESSMFQDLQIFENNEINKAIDSVYRLFEENFGEIGKNFMLCGSVAKVLHGELPEDYQPKDIDFVCFSYQFWRFLYANAEKTGAHITKLDVRIIIDFKFILIEVWKPILKNSVFGIFKRKLNYCYGNKNERYSRLYRMADRY